MSEKMDVKPAPILVKGASKTMKSSAAKAAAVGLQEYGISVAVNDAGAFFRRNTVATLELIDAAGIEDPTDADLHAASRDAIAANAAFDNERKWPDLHTPRIELYTGRINVARHVKAAAETWWDRTYETARAQGVEALVLDGRNPRDRLQAKMSEYSIGPVMELLCECEPGVAATRTLRGRGQDTGDKVLWERERASIIARRNQDANRPSEAHPFRLPTNWVDFMPGSDPDKIMADAVSHSADEYPISVRMDMALFERESMSQGVAALAVAAWDMVALPVR
ncbi:MAG TPA: hypothetical protein VGM08_03870 [Candidatus Saccharimonadales bacterium]|jgi:hypothetical protein